MTNERHLARDLLITTVLLVVSGLLAWGLSWWMYISELHSGFRLYGPKLSLVSMAVVIGVPVFGLLRWVMAALFKSVRSYVAVHRFPSVLWWFFAIAFFITLLSPGGGVHGSALKVVAKNDLTQIVSGLRNYKTEYGDFPQGTNAQITTALRGDNVRNIRFMDIPVRSINPQREFIDPWGTPYKIIVSGTESPRAYSFGKNKIDENGNGDDVKSW